MNKKIITLIGARKNAKMEDWRLGGFPLIAWPYHAIQQSKYLSINTTYISTNSSKLLTYFAQGDTPTNNLISRPDIYATDTAIDLDWIKHALDEIRRRGNECDIIVHLRATTPVIDINIVDEAIAEFLQVPEASSLRSAHKLNESPHKMFIKDGDYWKSFIQGEGEFFNKPRQSFPDVYHPNGYVDILRPEVIDSNVLHGYKIYAFETPAVIEVDTKQDLNNIERYGYEDNSTYKYMKEKYVSD